MSSYSVDDNCWSTFPKMTEYNFVLNDKKFNFLVLNVVIFYIIIINIIFSFSMVQKIDEFCKKAEKLFEAIEG